MAKRALLIGINKYLIPGADLRGCVNDVKDLSAALVQFYGFKKKDITVLVDGAATQKAMENGISSWCAGRKKETSGAPLLRPWVERAGRRKTGTRLTAATRFCARRISTGTILSATTGCGRRSTSCRPVSASPSSWTAAIPARIRAP